MYIVILEHSKENMAEGLARGLAASMKVAL